ncbi:unnamed protein product [Amoebophrya sp. A25]|nr:unnamed protein product [Amoebophrya sp. A25]|eukprot:GSA25T00022819001.1
MAAVVAPAPNDQALLKQQRKDAYEALAGPLEKLSVKQIVDFREQKVVSKTVTAVTTATLSIIAEVDNTLLIDVRAAAGGRRDGVPMGWSSAQTVMQKPGHYINAMRRFPYAVDSGRIPDTAISEARKYVESGSVPEPSAHPVAHQAHQWIHAAYNYFQLRRRTSMARGNAVGSQVYAAPTGNRVESGTSRSSASSGRWQKGFGATQSTTASGLTVPSSGSGLTIPASGFSSGGFSSFAPNSRTVGGVGANGRNNHAVHHVHAAPVQMPKSMPPKTTAGSRGPAQATVSARPASAHPRAKRFSSSMGGGGGLSSTRSELSSNISTDARRFVGLPDYEVELEQMRREVRELKSQQSKAQWDLRRQEKKTVAKTKADELEGIREWRASEQRAMKELTEQQKAEAKRRDLIESRDFQNFKKERKRMEQEAEKKFFADQYEYGKDFAEYRQAVREKEKAEEEDRARQKAERVAHERALKKQQALLEKERSEESRQLDRKLEIDKMKRDLLKQKDELMSQISYSHTRMQDVVNSDVWRTVA